MVTNPSTTVLRHNGDVFKTIAKTPIGRGSLGIQSSVAEMLLLAGVSLDDLNPVRLIDGQPFPSYRCTGIVLNVRMQYSNLRSFDMNDEVRCTLRVEALGGLWGYVGPEFNNNNRTNFFSVRIVMFGSGEIGTPDVFRLIVRVTSGVVMLGMANTLTEALMRLMGDRIPKPIDYYAREACAKYIEDTAVCPTAPVVPSLLEY